MPDVEIICLANSRKESGKCVAGLRTDGKGWIRPVTEEGPLTWRHYILHDNSAAKVLDVISINLKKPKPRTYQPENWLIGKLPWRLVARPAPQKYLQFIDRYITPGPELFGNTSDRVPVSSFAQKPAAASLSLVAPANLSWKITISQKGARQARAIFALQQAHYDLVVTDLQWEQRLSSLSPGHYSGRQVGLSDHDRVLLTVSLGRPFQDYCYKLAAAVIVLP